MSIGVDGLTEAEQREQLERFATDVAPVLRREIPSTVWSDTTKPSALAEAARAPEAVPA